MTPSHSQTNASSCSDWRNVWDGDFRLFIVDGEENLGGSEHNPVKPMITPQDSEHRVKKITRQNEFAAYWVLIIATVAFFIILICSQKTLETHDKLRAERENILQRIEKIETFIENTTHEENP